MTAFNVDLSCEERKLIPAFSDLDFMGEAHNVALMGGPGTGKSQPEG